MHDSTNELNVGMKAAQMGFTETVLNICFFAIDILSQDVLYVLPNAKPDAADFSSSRFDAALSLSPHLGSLFSDVQNVGHKRAGSANMFIRGSQSESGLKSISTPKIILDELKEMNQDNIALVLERASGQLEGTVQTWMISTPGVYNDDIHKHFLKTTQDHFVFKCPGCNTYIELTYPDNIEIVGEDETDPRIKESFYKCKCGKKLAHEDKREWLSLANGSHWVPSVTNKNARGFQIPQLYSMTMPAGKFAETHFKAQKDPAEEQQLFNSKMGLPHEVKGARVTQEELTNCVGEYAMCEVAQQSYNTMGVDQGGFLDLTISSWDLPGRAVADVNAASSRTLLKAIRLSGLDAFEQLDRFMDAFAIRHCVIDANPERRNAERFAARHRPGRISLCFYGNNVKTKVINRNSAANTITVDRTNWLDQSLSRVRNKTARLPVNRPREFDEHMKNQVRVYEKDKNGNNVARYKSTGDDHFGHAWNYDEIALPMSLGVGIVESITEHMV